MKKLFPITMAMAIATITSSCNQTPPAPTIVSAPFGTLSTGEAVPIYTLKNAKGMEARITPYGATLVSLTAPDRKGVFKDVVLGFDSLAGYTQTPPPPYFGATVGRYANRIAGAAYTLNGQKYTSDQNDGKNSLHGGVRGFDKVLWTAAPAVTGDGQSLGLKYLSKDGEEGYPGNLSVTVTYTLTADNELRIHYIATTDKPTIINLTNHTYFNLGGHDAGDILGHVVTLNADRFTPVDAVLIPTGELRSVTGTPFDFRQPKAVGERIGDKDEQMVFGKGYDHNWVVNRTGKGLESGGKVTDPVSGRTVEFLTTEPGVQLYTGNFLDGSFHGKGGAVYKYRQALTLETQHYPDSPNHPDFPSTVLNPGDRFDSTTAFRFSSQ